MSFRQARWKEPLIFEYGGERSGLLLPQLEEEIIKMVGEMSIPKALARAEAPRMPALSELEAIRHFTRLAQMSYGVDVGPVPLGSCTMKYNPRVALKYALHDKLAYLHPLIDEDAIQGLLEMLYTLERWLATITGMDRCSLHPAAGSQGELAGALIIRRYHELRGEIDKRTEIVVPDSAHGTNPATSTMAGFKAVEIPTAEDGNIDMEALRLVVGPQTAGIMMTVPSTLGLFEERALEVAELIHDVGGLVYYDGANLNGLLGYARPGDLGADIVHLNLHKTFSAPHGGGGPGAGPVCVKDREVAYGVKLGDLLPGFTVAKEGDKFRVRPFGGDATLLRAWFGNVSQLIWSFVYISSLGARGLRRAGEIAVINTNYFMKRILGETKSFDVPFAKGRPRKHEVVISAERLRDETGVTAEDIAKGLLDAGFYAPTIYFPLIVKEALMVEFTESETKENIDLFVERLKELERLAYERPEEIKGMPKNTARGRVDNAKANHPKTVTPTWRVKELRERGLIGSL